MEFGAPFPTSAATINEAARDAIGIALTAGSLVTITPNDSADTITVTVDTAGVDERARDAIAAAATAGTGMTITSDDTANTITFTIDTAAETERVQDTIGAILQDGPGLDWTYNDAGNAETVAVSWEMLIAVSDEATALTAGTGKITFRMPRAVALADVRASLATAQTSGNIFTVDVNEGGVSILSTKLTIDNTEKTTATAATPRVISDASLADDAEMTIDIDQIGDGTAKGLKVLLKGTMAS